MPTALQIVDEVVEESSVSAEDATENRFTVKTGMSYWVDVDYSHPERARQLLAGGETFDTDDQATIDILKLAPEFEDSGPVV